jgi:HSP20 family molecular chaperone IbpA
MSRQRRYEETGARGGPSLSTGLGLARNALQARLVAASAVTDTLVSSLDAVAESTQQRGPDTMAMLQRSAEERARMAEDLADSVSAFPRSGVRERSTRSGRGTGSRRRRAEYDDEPREVIRRPDHRMERTDGGYRFEFDMPGIDESTVVVEVDDESLHVEAERPVDDDGVTIIYARTVRLPRDASPDEPAASFDSGVLRVELPSSRRRVEVSGAPSRRSGSRGKGSSSSSEPSSGS